VPVEAVRTARVRVEDHAGKGLEGVWLGKASGERFQSVVSSLCQV
jgi:hypothetical protein